MAKLEEHGWHEPTAIQRQAIPILLDGRDLFAVAPTGQSLFSHFNYYEVLVCLKILRFAAAVKKSKRTSACEVLPGSRL